MFSKLICAIFLSLLAPLASFGQSLLDSTKARIILVGKGQIHSNDLAAAAGVKNGSLLSLSQLEATVRQILGQLRLNRFYDARVDSAVLRAGNDGKPAELRLHYATGPEYELRLNARIKSGTQTNIPWQRQLQGHHDEQDWTTRLAEALAGFGREGYPFAHFTCDSVRVTEIDNRDARAELCFTLDPGPLVHLDSISVKGNKVTKPYILLRELPVKPGDTFDLDKVESIPERLKRLEFIRSVAPPQLLHDAHGRFILEIEIVEGNSNSMNGVAGYNPGSETQKGYLTGLVDLKFGNLFGTGRLINARWEKRGPETQELALRYREPWVRGFPLHLSGGFEQLIQDTLYVEQRWDLLAELPIGSRLTLLGQIMRERVTPDSLAAERLLLPASNVTSVAGGLRYDSRDDLYNPRQGVFYSTTVETGRKSVSALGNKAAESFSRKKVSLDFEWLIPTRWPQVLSVALHGRQVTSGEAIISVTDQMRFGGATTLRGYREEQFRGSRVSWSSVEYRYLLSRQSRAFVFFDAGYYFRTEEDFAGVDAAATRDVEEIKTAFGAGVRIDTPLGIMGIDYGLGEGDEVLNGKVHVSLTNRF